MPSNGLLIRWSLVRFQPGEPIKSASYASWPLRHPRPHYPFRCSSALVCACAIREARAGWSILLYSSLSTLVAAWHAEPAPADPTHRARVSDFARMMRD